MKAIEDLLNNSGLPGPRGNLSLLYKFAYDSSPEEISECFKYENGNTSNSPQEFVVMCGVVAYCVSNKANIRSTLNDIRKYASHSSWRVRESVAIGFQEMAVVDFDRVIDELQKWLHGNEFEKRAVVATLCEPKLLSNYSNISGVFDILRPITLGFNEIMGKLSDAQESLRKALGYGLSVVIVQSPNEGKLFFEMLTEENNKHIHWILKSNLKKKRLSKMDEGWVADMLCKIT